jgi:O-antigen ligase
MPYTSATLTSGDRDRRGVAISRVPPPFLEITYYGYLFYSFFSDAIGISIPLFGFGILTAMTAYCCVILDSGRQISGYWSQRFSLACGASYLAIQLFVHGESLDGSYVRDFVPWLLTLIVVQALSRREGFLIRCAFVIVAIGMMVLPLLTLTSWNADGSVFRAGLDRSAGATGGLANSNSLADWFGFCVVFLVVIAIESRRLTVRAFSAIAATACLFVVGLTVSRGALLSISVALTIASRRFLKRGFVPLLLVFVVAWIAYASGLFDDIAVRYGVRGTEETGRFVVWPIAIGRWLASPLTGVGAAHAITYVPTLNAWITPHNGFLFIGLVSGLVPFVFFVLYWVQAAIGGLRSVGEHRQDAPFHLPLLAYALLATNLSGLTFMVPWFVITLTSAIGGGAVAHASRRRPTDERSGTRVTSPTLGASW